MGDSTQLREVILEAEGGPVPLAGYLQQRPLVVVLLRHLGCPLCREQLQLVAGMAEDIENADAALIAVVPESGGHAGMLAAEEKVDFAVLGDPERRLYRLLGMKRGSWYEVTLKPLLLAPWLGLRRLFRVRRPGRDVRQLGGVAIIDAAGVLRWCYRTEHSGEIVANKRVLDALANVNRNR